MIGALLCLEEVFLFLVDTIVRSGAEDTETEGSKAVECGSVQRKEAGRVK